MQEGEAADNTLPFLSSPASSLHLASLSLSLHSTRHLLSRLCLLSCPIASFGFPLSLFLPPCTFSVLSAFSAPALHVRRLSLFPALTSPCLSSPVYFSPVFLSTCSTVSANPRPSYLRSHVEGSAVPGLRHIGG